MRTTDSIPNAIPRCSTGARIAVAVVAMLVPISSNADDEIRVTNYPPDEVVRFSVPLLRGELGDLAITRLTATVESKEHAPRRFSGIVREGRFKILLELRPGENRIRLAAGKSAGTITLHYRPATNPYYVRVLWMTDKTGNATYQSPAADDSQDIDAKLDTALKLLQTATAERFYDLGFERRTFRLELDEAGRVQVHHWKRTTTAEQDYALFDPQWYDSVAQDVNEKFADSHAKNIVLASYTRFNAATKTVQGHTALGGGNLALFGSGNVFSWPARIDDIQSAMMSTKRIDPEAYFNDSLDRNTWWGAASTTLGAVLHELGHTFDLPHSRERLDFMTRGFDHLNRVFVFEDAATVSFPRSRVFQDRDIPAFQPVSAASFILNRWLAPDMPALDPENDIQVTLESESPALKIMSKRPIRFVGFLVRGDIVQHVVPESTPDDGLRIALEPFAKRIDAEDFIVRVQDDRGNLRDTPLRK